MTLASSKLPLSGLLPLLLSAACAGGLDDPDRFRDGAVGPSCPDGYEVEAQLLTPRCGVDGCHATSGPQAGLDLASPEARDRLLAASASSSCVGQPLLSPSAPQESVLYLKVAGTQCGAQMPSLGDTLSPVELDCLRRWIAGTSTTS